MPHSVKSGGGILLVPGRRSNNDDRAVKGYQGSWGVPYVAYFFVPVGISRSSIRGMFFAE